GIQYYRRHLDLARRQPGWPNDRIRYDGRSVYPADRGRQGDAADQRHILRLASALEPGWEEDTFFFRSQRSGEYLVDRPGEERYVPGNEGEGSEFSKCRLDAGWRLYRL